jgi:predicted MFS family arabinose efflux permease
MWSGGVIYITMFDRITKASGFPWAIRGMGFVALACALISFPALLSGSAVLARPRKARRLFDRTALHDRLFILFTISTFFNFLGYIVPYFYIPTYAREHLGSTDSMALYMLVMSLAGTFFGRLASGIVAHYLGSVVTWGLCCLGSGILALCWISIETERAFIAFSIMWGEYSGCRRLKTIDVWLIFLKAFCPPLSLRFRLPPSRASAPICASSAQELVCRGASLASHR